jgi:hypothetical protein
MHFIRDFKFFAGFMPGGPRHKEIAQSMRFRTMQDLSISL